MTNCAVVLVNMGFLLVARRVSSKVGSDAEIDEMIGFVKSLERRRIATIPTKLASIIDYRCYGQHDYFHYPAVCSPSHGLMYGLELEVEYNLLKPDLHELVGRYDIDTLIVRKADYENYKRRFGLLHGCMTEVVFENDGFAVLDVKAA